MSTQDQTNCTYKSRVNEQKSSPLRILCLYYLRKLITLLKYCLGFFLTEVVSCRSESPPVPAVKNRLHHVQQKQIHASHFLVHNSNSRREKNVKPDTQQRSSPPSVTEAGRPLSSQFIPYVRTNEVYYLDPDAPVTRPSTQDPQHRQFNGTEMYYELIHVEEEMIQ